MTSNKLAKAYQYLYYRIYKFLDDSYMDGFWMEWRAGGILFTIVVWFAISLFVYFSILVDLLFANIDAEIITYMFGACLCVLLLFVAIKTVTLVTYKSHWKKIIVKFNKLPQKENTKKGLIALSVVVLIVANLIFSFYLLSIVHPR
ncbi:MAG: hypothetical protein LBL97_02010 [Prevotellaceae bacterium]|jgi:hypothetical protein|nr:hypothetical protein [Prevotellaceae bacterium]